MVIHAWEWHHPEGHWDPKSSETPRSAAPSSPKDQTGGSESRGLDATSVLPFTARLRPREARGPQTPRQGTGPRSSSPAPLAQLLAGPGAQKLVTEGSPIAVREHALGAWSRLMANKADPRAGPRAGPPRESPGSAGRASTICVPSTEGWQRPHSRCRGGSASPFAGLPLWAPGSLGTTVRTLTRSR